MKLEYWLLEYLDYINLRNKFEIMLLKCWLMDFLFTKPILTEIFINELNQTNYRCLIGMSTIKIHKILIHSIEISHNCKFAQIELLTIGTFHKCKFSKL